MRRETAREQESDQDPEYPGGSDDWSQFLREPPQISVSEQFCLDRGLLPRLAARTSRRILRCVFRLCFQLELRGAEKLPQEGPFLLCPNHQSYLDPFFLYALLPGDLGERTLFVADRGYFEKPYLSWMNRFGRVILTGSRGRLPECLRLAFDGLRKGLVVCIFPEGKRTRTGSAMRPHRGAGILACETGAPIIPVRIDGATRVLSLLHPGIHFGPVSVSVCDPIHPLPEERPHDAILRRWQREMRRMETLSAAQASLDFKALETRAAPHA